MDHSKIAEWWRKYETSELRTVEEVAAVPHDIAIQMLYEIRHSTDDELAAEAREWLRRRLDCEGESIGRIETELDYRLFPLLSGPPAPWHRRIEDGFILRREVDMGRPRRIAASDFDRVYLTAVHQAILWTTLRDRRPETAFLVDESEQKRSLDGKTVETTDLEISVCHPSFLDEESRKKWQNLFAEFELFGFQQFDRTPRNPIRFEPTETRLSIATGVSESPMRDRGWSGTPASHRRWLGVVMERKFSWDSQVVVSIIRRFQNGIWIFFERANGEAIPFGEIHPVVLAEVQYVFDLARDSS